MTCLLSYRKGNSVMNYTPGVPATPRTMFSFQDVTLKSPFPAAECFHSEKIISSPYC